LLDFKEIWRRLVCRRFGRVWFVFYSYMGVVVVLSWNMIRTQRQFPMALSKQQLTTVNKLALINHRWKYFRQCRVSETNSKFPKSNYLPTEHKTASARGNKGPNIKHSLYRHNNKLLSVGYNSHVSICKIQLCYEWWRGPTRFLWWEIWALSLIQKIWGLISSWIFHLP